MTAATTTPETTAPEYRAQTDAATKTWHLGAVARAEICYCGTRLMTPGDTRAFALKVPADRRNYQTDPDVAKVTCKGCRKNREYLKATAAPLAGAAAGRPRRRRTPAAEPTAAR